MSAYIFRRYANRVELIADGGQWNDFGTLIGQRDKLTVSGHAPLAMTGRGKSAFLEKMTANVMYFAEFHSGDFDRTIVNMAHHIQIQRAKFPDYAFGGDFVVAGMSESQGPVGWTFDIEGNEHRPPCRLVPAGDWQASGIVLGDVPPAEFVDMTNTGLREAALPLFEMTRTNQRAAGKPVKVACHIDWAVVDANGARVERLHEWPDDVALAAEQ